MPSSEQRSTIQHYPPGPINTYYGDESDEGLVRLVFFKYDERNLFYRIACHQQIQLFLIIIIVCHMTVMIKMVIHSSIGIYFFCLILAYRQQIREKSQPTHIVCNRNANLSNKILFTKNLVSSMASCIRPTARKYTNLHTANSRYSYKRSSNCLN